MINFSLTGLLLLSTLLSCAAVNTDSTTNLDRIKSSTTNKDPYHNYNVKPEPNENFNYKKESEYKPEETTPITVIKPPSNTVVNYSYLDMINSGHKNKYGNPIYLVNMYKEGQLVATVKAVTGRVHTQQKDRNVAGTEAPLPNGKYKVASYWINSNQHEVGGQFLPISPMFSTGRTALGFHVDPSYNKDKKEDGTAGCIGLTTIAERNLLFTFVQQHKPKYLQVSI